MKSNLNVKFYLIKDPIFENKVAVSSTNGVGVQGVGVTGQVVAGVDESKVKLPSVIVIEIVGSSLDNIKKLMDATPKLFDYINSFTEQFTEEDNKILGLF